MKDYTFSHNIDLEKNEEYLQGIVDMSLTLNDIGACNRFIGKAIHGLEITIGDIIDMELDEKKYNKMRGIMIYI